MVTVGGDINQALTPVIATAVAAFMSTEVVVPSVAGAFATGVAGGLSVPLMLYGAYGVGAAGTLNLPFQGVVGVSALAVAGLLPFQATTPAYSVTVVQGYYSQTALAVMSSQTEIEL